MDFDEKNVIPLEALQCVCGFGSDDGPTWAEHCEVCQPENIVPGAIARSVEPGYTTTAYQGYTLQDGLDSVGSGWGDLVRKAFNLLPKGARIAQIKEKFGGLRIYVDQAPTEYYDLIDGLEEASTRMCEFCGSFGMSRDINGWYQTLCDYHFEERENKA